MAQLNVRIDDAARISLDALAQARGTQTSDLVRSLIDEALGRDAGRPYADLTPRSLSVVERRTLALHHRTLALLASQDDSQDESEMADGNAQDHLRAAEVLERGYTAEYPTSFIAINQEMGQRECDLVHDVLEMFTHLELAWSRLADPDRTALVEADEHAEHRVRFRGFDFNDPFESRLAAYARYLIRTDRWETMADRFDREHERGNSHAPLLASYQRQLDVWRPLWQQKKAGALQRGPRSFDLTVDELRDVLRAR